MKKQVILCLCISYLSACNKNLEQTQNPFDDIIADEEKKPTPKQAHHTTQPKQPLEMQPIPNRKKPQNKVLMDRIDQKYGATTNTSKGNFAVSHEKSARKKISKLESNLSKLKKHAEAEYPSLLPSIENAVDQIQKWIGRYHELQALVSSSDFEEQEMDPAFTHLKDQQIFALLLEGLSVIFSLKEELSSIMQQGFTFYTNNSDSWNKLMNILNETNQTLADLCFKNISKENISILLNKFATYYKKSKNTLLQSSLEDVMEYISKIYKTFFRQDEITANDENRLIQKIVLFFQSFFNQESAESTKNGMD